MIETSIQFYSEAIQKKLLDKVEFALLFGSSITDRFTNNSDIDIGIYCKEHSMTFEHRLALLGELEASINREIDLILLNTSDIIITMQIIANGKLIINNNPGLFTLFKAQKIGEYIDFKQDRKIIEDNLFTRRLYA
jgi:uncharacterized protein